MAGNKIVRLGLLLLFASLSGWAQENRYMVFFKDKNGIAQTTANPIEFLSQKAIQRRLDQNIDITDRDLPVQRDYIQGVKDAGGETRYSTRWFNGVLVTCQPSEIQSIAALPYVDRTEYLGPPEESSGGRRSFNVRKNTSHAGVETESQLKMLGIDEMHEAGFAGKDVVIAIFDSGFPGVNVGSAFQNLFAEGRFDEDVSYDFVHHSPDVFHHDDHGTEVFSVIAAEIPDAYTGGAPKATFQLFVTEDVPSEYRIEEYNWVFAAERADSAGADIIHASVGYYDFDDPSMNYTVAQMDGKTTVVTRAAQWASERGIVVVTSAGNEGNIPSWRIITAPADGQDVLAVGGVNHSRQKTSSSSIGPSADGRVKPDLAALGSGVKVVKASGQISTASGTSLSAPLVTSLVAGVMVAYPELSGRDIVALLRETASQANMPDNLLGYGIPNFKAVVNFLDRVQQTEPFAIYPNPLKGPDTLIIRPMDPETFDACQIEIVSSQGQVLASARVTFDWLNRTHQTTVLSGLAPGIYYIRISANKKRHTFRVVKLR
ncbi:MAG: S8 family peptidase [Bacteroidota bacterium]|nr:S8 family peptidase [Bacteroidota bacterium]